MKINGKLHGFTLLENLESINTDKLFKWSCSQGHLISQRGKQIKKWKENACKVCVKNKIKKRYFDYLTMHNLELLEEYESEVKCMKHKCRICSHMFEVTPKRIKTGFKCPKCFPLRLSNDLLKKRIETWSNGLITLDETSNYESSKIKVMLKCLNIECEYKWTILPLNILNKKSRNDCPKCGRHKAFSCISIRWLNDLMKKEEINIQHAQNGGEHCFFINGKRYLADGYCKETNTIYEFYGTIYHGDLRVFNEDDKCHPFEKNKTAKELYDYTMWREDEIKKLGYNLVSIWENDYLKV